MEPPQQVCEGNTDLTRNSSVIHKLFNITKVHLLECLRDT